MPDTTYEYIFTLLIAPTIDGGYVATCRAFPDLVIAAGSLVDAHARAEEAIRRYVQRLRKEGSAIPGDNLIAQEIVKRQIRVTVTV